MRNKRYTYMGGVPGPGVVPDPGGCIRPHIYSYFSVDSEIASLLTSSPQDPFSVLRGIRLYN